MKENYINFKLPIDLGSFLEAAFQQMDADFIIVLTNYTMLKLMREHWAAVATDWASVLWHQSHYHELILKEFIENPKPWVDELPTEVVQALKWITENLEDFNI